MASGGGLTDCVNDTLWANYPLHTMPLDFVMNDKLFYFEESFMPASSAVEVYAAGALKSEGGRSL